MVSKKNLNFGENTILLSFIMISFAGLVIFKELYVLWSLVLGLNSSIFIFRIINLQERLKLLSAILTFMFIFGSSFFIGTFAKDKEVKKITNNIIQNATSKKSSIRNQTINFELVNNKYNVAQNASAIIPLDSAFQNNKKLFSNINNTTKNIKNFRVLQVLSSTTIEVSELGIIQLLGNQNPTSNLSCFEEFSMQRLKDIIIGRNVYLEFDNEARYDSFGRVLAYVYLDSDYFVNFNLIKEGYNSIVTKDISNHFRSSQYAAIESEAKLVKSGLWAENPCEKQIVSKSAVNSSKNSISSISSISRSSRQNIINASASSKASIAAISSSSTTSSSSSVNSIDIVPEFNCIDLNNQCYYTVADNNNLQSCVIKGNINQSLFTILTGPYKTISECTSKLDS